MTGFVYAIECNGRIKLGYSESPEKRVNKVASDAPFPCVLLGYWHGSVADELDVQTKFQSIRVHGEWFAATEDLLAFIQQNVIPIEPAPKKHKTILDTDSPLTAWRKRAGLRQHELASMLGVNTSFVSQLENGISGPSLEVAMKIADLCGPTVPITSLMRKSREVKP